jgi:hypothetical protein
MRRRLAQHGFGADRAFRWRGGEASRLEGLSDPVFAFAVCFSILFWVWYDHYRFFRRYGLADSLELNAYERLATRSEIQSFALNVLVGLASIVIVTVGGPDAAFWSGMAYMLIMPLQTVNGRLMRTRIYQAETASTREPSAS